MGRSRRSYHFRLANSVNAVWDGELILESRIEKEKLRVLKERSSSIYSPSKGRYTSKTKIRITISQNTRSLRKFTALKYFNSEFLMILSRSMILSLFARQAGMILP